MNASGPSNTAFASTRVSTSPLPSDAVSDHGASGGSRVIAYEEVSKIGIGTGPAAPPDCTGAPRCPEHPAANNAQRARSRRFITPGTHHARRRSVQPRRISRRARALWRLAPPRHEPKPRRGRGVADQRERPGQPAEPRTPDHVAAPGRERGQRVRRLEAALVDGARELLGVGARGEQARRDAGAPRRRAARSRAARPPSAARAGSAAATPPAPARPTGGASAIAATIAVGALLRRSASMPFDRAHRLRRRSGALTRELDAATLSFSTWPSGRSSSAAVRWRHAASATIAASAGARRGRARRRRCRHAVSGVTCAAATASAATTALSARAHAQPLRRAGRRAWRRSPAGGGRRRRRRRAARRRQRPPRPVGPLQLLAERRAEQLVGERGEPDLIADARRTRPSPGCRRCPASRRRTASRGAEVLARRRARRRSGCAASASTIGRDVDGERIDERDLRSGCDDPRSPGHPSGRARATRPARGTASAPAGPGTGTRGRTRRAARARSRRRSPRLSFDDDAVTAHDSTTPHLTAQTS